MKPLILILSLVLSLSITSCSESEPPVMDGSFTKVLYTGMAYRLTEGNTSRPVSGTVDIFIDVKTNKGHIMSYVEGVEVYDFNHVFTKKFIVETGIPFSIYQSKVKIREKDMDIELETNTNEMTIKYMDKCLYLKVKDIKEN